VSIAVKVLSLNSIEHLSLAQLISPEQDLPFKALTFQFNDSNLFIEKNGLHLTSDAENINVASGTTEKRVSLTTDIIELVVFGDISFKNLNSLFENCELDSLELNAINKRNDLISYRFKINVKNVGDSRKLLVDFCQKHTLEAAILVNAPRLTEPGILVMDMDSTTIEIECIDEIAILAGVGEQVAEVTELAMQGKLDFAQSLHQRVATLKNAPEKILSDVAKNLPLMNGLETLIDELKVHQWRIAIASGGFTYFADHLKELLSLDAAFANKLEVIDNKLTGKVLGDVVDAQAKAQCLSVLSDQYKIAHAQTVAMGDGANDLTMMSAAALGVAFHAKPVVLAQADSSIHFSGLDCLLHWLA
jgi:phosphoserine phosphatase